VTDILKALFSNSAALTVFLVAVCLFVLAVIAIYVLAFWQGRSLSFWPPNIGAKPQPERPSKRPDASRSIQSPPASTWHPAHQGAIPSISAGTQLMTSSGNTVLIESNSYIGVRATLMKAKDRSERHVMVKLFWRGLNPSSDAWNEFSREYKATDGLHHRNIVETTDRGLWNGYPFLVLEFFPGGTLHDLIRSRDQMPGPEIVSIAEQIASGIDYAHSQGRVHRDITPSNILIESDAHGRVAISDFGIARTLGALETRITAAAPGFEGTPAYVAPEVFSSNRVTPLVDIYGFGVVLFEMIAGRCPFPNVETVYELFELKLRQPVPRLKSFREAPDDLDQRLFDTLDPAPERRPQSARAVLSGIEQSLLSL
jgi:serine/threonine protein kinase